MDLDSDLFTLPTSSAPPVLAQLMEEKLRELAFCAVSPAGRIEGAEIARLKPQAGPPRKLEDLVSRYKQDFEDAKTNADRLAVVKRCQEHIGRLKYAPPRKKQRGTIDWKVAVAQDARPSHVVGEMYGISPSYVRKLRKALRDGRIQAVEVPAERRGDTPGARLPAHAPSRA